MGTFAGHLLPGSFFIVFGIRWAIEMFKRLFTGREQSIGTASYPSNRYSHVPIEGYTKIICCTIGMIGEFVTAFKHGQFVLYGNTQHMAMFFFFGINGLIDVLLFYEAPGIPRGSDYATLALAVFVEGLLFFFHLHGRSPLDVHVHQLLLVAIVVCFAAVVTEWIYQGQPLAVMFRCYGALWQGLWFVQVGFILYNPLPGAMPWADHNHDQMMLVTTMFCAHMAAALGILALIGLWVRGCCVQRGALAKVDHGSLDRFDQCSYKKLSTHEQADA